VLRSSYCRAWVGLGQVCGGIAWNRDRRDSMIIVLEEIAIQRFGEAIVNQSWEPRDLLAVPLRLSTRISLVSRTGLPANASCCGTQHAAPPKSLLPLLRGILTRNWYCLRMHAHRGGLDPFARQQVNGRVGRRGPNKCCSDELQPGGARK
jgi:hypothetical protein